MTASFPAPPFNISFEFFPPKTAEMEETLWRAIQRLESYSPPWPMPKIFRLTSGGKFSEAIFKGDTINTPSMLCVEDAIDGLRWGESVGGLKALIARSEANLGVLEGFVASRPWAAFLAADKAIRSNTSVCLTIAAPWFTALPADKQAAIAAILTFRDPERFLRESGYPERMRTTTP